MHSLGWNKQAYNVSQCQTFLENCCILVIKCEVRDREEGKRCAPMKGDKEDSTSMAFDLTITELCNLREGPITITSIDNDVIEGDSQQLFYLVGVAFLPTPQCDALIKKQQDCALMILGFI